MRYLKSGLFPSVLSGAMISMGRLLEKLGPALYIHPSAWKVNSAIFAMTGF